MVLLLLYDVIVISTIITTELQETLGLLTSQVLWEYMYI